MPSKPKSRPVAPDSLPPYVDEQNHLLRVIIETPKGSRNKYSFNEEFGLFEMRGVLSAGAYFPFDFGFIPSTKGGDGDPLDVLLLMDEPAFPGCLLTARLLGVIEAEQTEGDKTEKNDRLIAVAANSRNHEEIRGFSDLPENLLKEIEHFFVSYNEVKGKTFQPLGRKDVKRAEQIVAEGIKRFAGKQSGPKTKARAKAKPKKKKS